jgi:hemolysin III
LRTGVALHGDDAPVPAGAGATTSGVDAPVRPRWRGRLHRWAAIVAVPAFAALVAAAPTASSRLACAVYGVGVTAMLGVSAVYHAPGVPESARPWLRRLDHSTILLAITGSYTAIVALVLSGTPERRLLLAVWLAAGVALVVRMTWHHAPSPVIALVYLLVGWSALLEWRALLAATTVADKALLVAGALLYTLGGVVYGVRRPDPWPRTFGYHEVFHALVVAGVLAHYVLVWTLVL